MLMDQHCQLNIHRIECSGKNIGSTFEMIITYVFKGKKNLESSANKCPELHWNNCHKIAKNTER